LREFYGLNTAEGNTKDPLHSGEGLAGCISIKLILCLPSSTDSPAFDAKQVFDHLYTSASLVELLKQENKTLNDIKELDSERQALVYNHHHELIDASDTIKKVCHPPSALLH